MPYFSSDGSAEHSAIRVQNSRLIDTGGGFLIEEEDLRQEQEKEVIIAYLYIFPFFYTVSNFQYSGSGHRKASPNIVARRISL